MANNRKNVGCLAVIAGFAIVAILVWIFRPQPERRPPQNGPQLAVETMTIDSRDYQVRLQSYGTVQPMTRSILVAQVSGQIVSINPNVRDGGFFEKGDVLGEIDPRDYEADVRIAEATLMDARQALAEAEARSVQAAEDWERLGNEGDAPSLVLRVPQLEAAKARVISAQSGLRKAQLDLERTKIVAPFAGRVLRKFVDLGQVVSANTQLAEIYATDTVEIRLPLRNRDLPYIDLPESFRFASVAPEDELPVVIRSDLMGPNSWEARLVRTEGAIDESARQLHVIAEIEDPFGKASEGHNPLKIGQYVTAEMPGRTVSDAVVIPNNTIYQGSYVYVVDDGILRRKDIEVAWQNDSEAIIAGSLQVGDELVLTPLGQVTSGIRVTAAPSQSAQSGTREAAQ
ncbi:MAG: efflux RND transporter periplasmic adaptor subunit [Gammaproteobacteria bacterium]|nr:efflux RND transporter periplasmic adaptor subunit [Gammaproteobacteria bacterium]MDH3373332.1 efflux RND transporter periplasmic adaptor subunit [Gammaproteobacteria bacterium]MDH3410158.1 efflux RND transporter periplasmic adaptor subunit [Gammaproteobacteria bacterium]MDH3552900.1 efflux RND transporter periplasmic adaptor subunit [Gammaproteobacteria bacterium]